jgi:preprotein translocase subunit SecE
MNKAINFFKEAYGELKKATWLGRNEVVQFTIVVCVFSALVAAYVGAIDLGLMKIMSFMLRREI